MNGSDNAIDRGETSCRNCDNVILVAQLPCLQRGPPETGTRGIHQWAHPPPSENTNAAKDNLKAHKGMYNNNNATSVTMILTHGSSTVISILPYFFEVFEKRFLDT